MSRTARKIDIKEIRTFTARNGGNVSTWLPSIGGDFKNTFTIKGLNYDGTSSTGEINSNTIFGKGTDELGKTFDNTNVLDENLIKFYLILYCLMQDPLKNPSIIAPIIQATSQVENDRIFDKNIEQLFLNLQTYNVGLINSNEGKTISRSLTTDAVRFYRKNKIGKLDPLNEDIFTNLINFAKIQNGDYQTNVAGVLGRVTYDSIVKHTLYNLLKINKIVKDIEIPKGSSWLERASKVAPDKQDVFVDVSGGPYSRAFPVACVIFKDKKNKKLSDFLELSNNLVGNEFNRKLNSQDQLVSVISEKEKNFIEIPERDTGSSIYCIVYDLIKILVLDPIANSDNFIDLIRIGLSFLSRFGFKQDFKFTKQKLKEEIQKINSYLKSNFSDLSEKNYEIVYKNKHLIETSYILSEKDEVNKPKIAQSFKAEIEKLCKSLEEVYDQVIKSVDYDSFYLHFDRFYNLLAITTNKTEEQAQQAEINDSIPFVIEDYASYGFETDLVKLFFENEQTLPKFGDNNLYTFDPELGRGQKVLFITDAFVKELYEILDSQGIGLVYDTDANSTIDDVKLINSSEISILNLIDIRTGGKYKLKKEDYFINDNGKIKTKPLPYGVKLLDITSLAYSFTSVGIEKIKLQTLSHFLFISFKDNPTEDDFIKIVYYPRIKEGPGPTPPPPPPPPEDNPGTKELKAIQRDYLINNIIAAELPCYEDIANSFDKAINEELPEDKIYYIFQTISNIGLPFLLAYISQMIVGQLNSLLKQGDSIDPDLLECATKDLNKVKKTIINYADLLSNLDNPQQLAGLFIQEVPEIPQIPQIQYLFTFDSEKELKRKIVEYAINMTIKYISGKLKSILKAFVDICNSDSYLTAFLESAFAIGKEENIKKISSTPSGLINRSNGPVYIPSSVLNINDLIVKSSIQPKEYVYITFRQTFFVSEEKYTNKTISDFFDKLSLIIDSGEMAMLLKGSSSIDTRNVLVNFIKNYLVNGVALFNLIINDEQGVALLFSLLSNYIDYRICYEEISNSILNFTPTVCFDVNSRYDDNIKYFDEDSINNQINDLLKTLDDICTSTLPGTFRLLEDGPSIVTKSFVKTIVSSVVAATRYKQPKTTSAVFIKQIANIKDIYNSSNFYQENKELKNISDLKKKSIYVLKNAFRIGMSYTDYSFKLTSKNNQIFYEQMSNNGTSIKLFKSVENGKLYPSSVKYVNFDNYFTETQEFVNDFLNEIIWSGEDLGDENSKFNQSPPDVNGYYGKNLDNQYIYQLFTGESKVSEESNKLWKETKKETPSDLSFQYDLYLLANFHQDFINTVLFPLEDIEYNKFVFEEFIKLQQNPSLEQYYLFAVSLYKKAYELEIEILGQSTKEIDEDVEPWLEVKCDEFINDFIYKGDYSDEIKFFINNLGNVALKTDEQAIQGYINKYILFRKTNTKIYDSKVPGKYILQNDKIINFIEKV